MLWWWLFAQAQVAFWRGVSETLDPDKPSNAEIYELPVRKVE